MDVKSFDLVFKCRAIEYKNPINAFNDIKEYLNLDFITNLELVSIEELEHNGEDWVHKYKR